MNKLMKNSKQIKITPKIVFKVFFFLFLFFLYHLSEYGNSWAGNARGGMWKIGGGVIPYATLPGVFTSVCTFILIAWVVYYRKFGFYFSMTILTLRFIRLGRSLLMHNLMVLPGIFMSIVALVSILLIYHSNEQTIRTQKKHRKELEEFNKSIIDAFTNCIDGKDTYTNGHSFRVAKYTTMIAKKLGITDQKTLDKYYNIGLLHDIGKISIPDAILTKPGKLSPEEFDTIKSHAQRGYNILKDVKIQDDIAAGAHYHHERFDGMGYPDGLKGKAIPEVARIIAVADAFDAMSSTRSYREKLSFDFIEQEIEKFSGTQFDPQIAQALLDLYHEGAFDYLKE
ncbi:MAG: HD-GYP domain-containing protein [Spirochaetaceae bacterium]|nr:HD-GYP domain-containing protein [Spirochaetaceae bacterium]